MKHTITSRPYYGPKFVAGKRIRHEYDLLFACSNGTIDQTVEAAMDMARDAVHSVVDHIWYEAIRRWREQDIKYDLRLRGYYTPVTQKQFNQQYPITLEEAFNI